MPPKQKGQNVRGRDKIFRHAVEHVHIGVGHAALGNLSLQLAAGPPPWVRRTECAAPTAAAPVTTLQAQQQAAAALLADRPAFYSELNAQLLSHTSKDFKTFRWEVFELCETRPLFLHHRYAIARKLLNCLLVRTGGSFSSTSKAATAAEVDRGLTSEAFEGFARLTIAFARDLQADFLPFYEVFQQAMQAGLFDRKGNLIADVARLQLVYSVQAAWCRELAPHWLPPAPADGAKFGGGEGAEATPAGLAASDTHHKLVRRITGIYIRQMHDTKEYIRRLAAEWLAGLCRQCPAMIALVCELACGRVLADFEEAAVAQVRAAVERAAAEAVDALAEGMTTRANNEDEEDDVSDDGEGHRGEGAGAVNADGGVVADKRKRRGRRRQPTPSHTRGKSREAVDADEEGESEEEPSDTLSLESLAHDVWSPVRVRAFLASELAVHPVVDGLSFFAAELFRGMRGTLSTLFERMYVRLLEGFLLLDPAGRQRLRRQQQQQQQPHGTDAVHHFLSSDEEESPTASGAEETPVAHTRAAIHPRFHGERWGPVFGFTTPTHTIDAGDGDAAGMEREDAGQAEGEGATCTCAAAVRTATFVVRAIGSQAMGAALEALMVETKRHSFPAAANQLSESDTEEEAADVDEMRETATWAVAARQSARSHRGLADGARGGDDQYLARPSHRLLNAVVVCLDAGSEHHLRVLGALLGAAGYALWADERETPLLRRLATALRRAATRTPTAPSSTPAPATAAAALTPATAHVDDVALEAYTNSLEEYMGFAGALLELLHPLCATPFLAPDAQEARATAWLLELQKQFLPAAKVCVTAVAAIGYKNEPAHTRTAATDEAARRLLFAFAQDVLQKNLTFCLAEERRLHETHAALYREGTSDDDEDDEEGARRAARGARRAGGGGDHVHKEKDADREEAYVEEEGETSARQRTTVGSARAGRGVAAPPVISPSLTPLALTLLHSVCGAAWTAANTALAGVEAVAPADRRTQDRVVVVGLVDSAVLLARLTLDRTRHMRSSPLQQLIRLVSAEANGAGAAGAHLRHVLEELLCRLTRLAEVATDVAGACGVHGGRRSILRGIRTRALDWLSAALPLVGVVARATAVAAVPEAPSSLAKDEGRTPDAHTSGSPRDAITAGLLAVLHNIRTSSGMAHDTTAAAMATSQEYAMYVRVSVVLLHLTGGPRKAARSAGGAEARQESLRHLCDMIMVLASGFRAQQAARETAAEGDAAEALDALPSDESRGQLFHAAELLMDALLSAIGVDAAALDTLEGETPHRSGSRRESTSERNAPRLDSATTTALRALAALQAALPVDAQRALVEVVLFESLTAPTHALRARTLRLLRLLCHPHYPALAVRRAPREADEATHAYFAGAGPLDLGFVDDLLAAEEFNPLSQTGNLDGVRQALAKVAFAAEAGTLLDPLARVVLARAMVGLLSMKFADAWPVALKILVGLVRTERTAVRAMTEDSGERVDEGDRQAPGHRRGGRTLLEPLVWQTVITRYARLLVLGDVIGGESGTGHEAAADPAAGESDDDKDNKDDKDDKDEEAGERVGSAALDSFAAPTFCFYRIRLTDFERHQRGELVSKAFSHEQYLGGPGLLAGAAGGGRGGRVALATASEGDGDVLTWSALAADLRGLGVGGRGARARHSTDRATLARTFMSALEEMVKSASRSDAKLRLVESLVLELVAVQRGEHPALLHSGGGGASKRVEERLALAMRACSSAPTTALTPSERARLPAELVRVLVRRGEELERVFLSYTSDANAKLQRAALDNLKRLRVEPFCTYHAQLTPYCDAVKPLFGFLASFHMETDIPARAQMDYISAALSLALPKLIANVSREKRRDQAVLRRRLMGFIMHLSDRMAREDGGAGTGIAAVLDRLVQQLVFSRVSRSGAQSEGTEAEDDGTRRPRQRLQPEDFNFLGTWRASVARAVDAARAGTGGGRHCTRQLERLCRQLLSTTQLLDALLHAVGTRFIAYVGSCLHLSLQAYLLACKQALLEPIDEALAAAASKTEAQAEGDGSDRVAAFAHRVKRALGGSALSTVLSQLRRAALKIVAQLMEQFPEHVMELMERSPGLLHTPEHGVDEAAAWTPRRSLFAAYLDALRRNSRGTTRDGRSGGGGGDGYGAVATVPLASSAAAAAAVASRAQRSYVTPVLRLLLAWSRSRALLPLFAVFPDVTVSTFEEVFAVTDAESRGGTAHRASTPALLDGLRCLNALLELRDETVAMPATVAHRARAASRPVEVDMTFDAAFLTAHVPPIFAAIYRLVARGADAGAGELTNSSARAAPQRQEGREGRHRSAATRSILSFHVSTWKALMQTTALLAGYVTESGAATCARAAGVEEAGQMLGHLVEVALRVVTHPACVVDRGTALVALDVVDRLLRHLPAGELDAGRHYTRLVHLTNVMALPEARVKLCGTLEVVLATKLGVEDAHRGMGMDAAGVVAGEASQAVFRAQLAAVGRAVRCLNSFDDHNENLTRYDFELRYHTYHSLIHFFNNKGNYGALAPASRRAALAAPAEADTVRKERDYSGELDVRIPIDHHTAPLLCVDGFLALAASVVFLLRDPESTIRALSMQLLGAMLRYASTAVPPNPRGAAAAEGNGCDADSAQSGSRYAQCILEEVIRRELLPSLRRGVVAKDVNVRTDHMAAFGFLGRYYAEAFPSIARLYSPNTEQNFFLNVGHAQPKCRLHALALLRREAGNLAVRDVLRIFVPFLMSAVKDVAQGKRELRNLTEAKARGYSDAVLKTIASLSQNLPWEGYYRILTLFLANASANASLRAPMLRGVVQVLGHFHYLDAEATDTIAEGGGGGGGEATGAAPDVDTDTDTDEDGEDAEAAQVDAAVRERRRQFRHQRITQVIEQDVLPQLFEFIGDGGNGRKALGALTSGGEFAGMQHSVTAIRRAQGKEDAAASSARNAILQLPVAIAIARIIKKLPEERFHTYADHVLDEVVRRLRTKNDKHRDSARRILGVLLRETGPGKLRFVVTKLRDNLVHGYQLHVLGYTIVTLLHQLYEPHSAISDPATHGRGGAGDRGTAKSREEGVEGESEDVLDAVRAAARRGKELQRTRSRRRTEDGGGDDADADDRAEREAAGRKDSGRAARRAVDPSDPRTAAEREADDALEAAEEALLAELMPDYAARRRKGLGAECDFDHAAGVRCLTDLLDELMAIFLDDYLGEVGTQKEQTELMSTMVEVKRNRALQGFSFLARHCEAGRVMDAFLHRITWVLTPPSDTTVDVSQLHGSARARALLMQELRSKYLTVGKSAGADLVFLHKVRLLATRVARALMSNPTMHVDKAFAQVRELLDRHNAVREAKIRAFEARDGTRRIRGNAHMVIHKAQHETLKEQMEKNFLVEPVPERVDLDFSAHTVLATQQKQKLRVYKGRYGKEVRDAAKDFYREDPTTAVVLDTLDEFLMRFLLSVLKRVLGIGKESKYTTAAVQLDLLRQRRQRAAKASAAANPDTDGDDAGAEHEAHDDKDVDDHANGAAAEESGELDDNDNEYDDDDVLDPAEVDSSVEDELEAFADAQRELEEEEQEKEGACAARRGSTRHGGAAVDVADEPEGVAVTEDGRDAAETTATGTDAPLLRAHRRRAKLSVSFTTTYRDLLESLVPSVLASLQGEGSDPVVANALDCLLALVSLRPPLSAVHELNTQLFTVVTGFFERGGSIKQRAMRVCAAVIAHQPFRLADDQAAQLMRLVRAEIVERSPFLPMALSIFYAIVGKHNHVAEVYDTIDMVTELMVHLSAKPVIVRRCVMTLVRFLTEFRLTADAFRSHVDLLCKNLDYPDLMGRLALLDTLDTLAARLPVRILRAEAPFLLVPLAATITSGEWRPCRERAGRVLQNIARFAGVDVLAPTLAGWLAGAHATRPQRTMAAQVWATVLPALTRAYHLPNAAAAVTRRGGDGGRPASAAVATEEERAAFLASCEWSLAGVLQGCLHDQLKAAGGKLAKVTDAASVARKDRAAAEMKGWTLLFYSLRCAEAMLVALPDELYPRLAPELVRAIVDRLLTHTHPWVQSVALRILRHYCYTFLEPRCLYLQETIAPSVTEAVERDTMGGSGGVEFAAESDDPHVAEAEVEACALPYALAPLPPLGGGEGSVGRSGHGDAEQVGRRARQTWCAGAMHTFDSLNALLKSLLSRVGLSDVANEHQRAHRVLAEDAARTEGLKLMVYVSKALAHTAASLLVAAASTPPRYVRQLQQELRMAYASLLRHVHALVRPVLEQRAVTNYMVRTATLVQFLGAFVSVLPQCSESDSGAEDGGNSGSAEAALALRTREAVRWLLVDGMRVLAFVHRTVRPLLAIAAMVGRGPAQQQLRDYTHHSSTAIRQQLEERRALFDAPRPGDATERQSAEGDEETVGVRMAGKRLRREGGVEELESANAAAVKRRRLSKAGVSSVAPSPSPSAPDPTLDATLTSLAASLAHAREAEREEKVAVAVRRHRKRDRHEMAREERRGYGSGGGIGKGRGRTGAGGRPGDGKAKMAVKKRFGSKGKR